MAIEIEKINYKKQNSLTILDTILSKWFKDPKVLNFTEPKMPYPFNFNKWMKIFYYNNEIDSYVIKKDGWIVCFGSIEFISSETVLLKHFCAEDKKEGKGQKIRLINFFQKNSLTGEIKKIKINLMKKDFEMIKIIKNLKFKKGKSGKKIQQYYKEI